MVVANNPDSGDDFTPPTEKKATSETDIVDKRIRKDMGKWAQSSEDFGYDQATTSPDSQKMDSLAQQMEQTERSSSSWEHRGQWESDGWSYEESKKGPSPSPGVCAEADKCDTENVNDSEKVPPLQNGIQIFHVRKVNICMGEMTGGMKMRIVLFVLEVYHLGKDEKK